MISNNQQKIGDKKIKGKVGGLANESRFFTTERELRKHKIIVIPSVNTSAAIKLEQGWDRRSKQNDIVRVTLGDKHTIITREELEQGIAALAQGMETIKYQPSVIAPGEEYLKKHL